MRKVWVIACREYQAAVRTKAFVFSIIMMPVLWGASIGLQVLMKKAEDQTTKKVLVVDRTPGQRLKPALDAALEFRNRVLVYDPETKEQVRPKYELIYVDPSPGDADSVLKQRYDLSQQVKHKEFDGLMEIGPDVLSAGPRPAPGEPIDAKREIQYRSGKLVSDFGRWADRAVNEGIQQHRFAEKQVSPDLVREIQQPVPLKAKGLTERDPVTGALTDASDESQVVSFVLPAILIVLMYVMILLGASPAMQGVVEEKQLRIAEVLLGSVRPFALMAGKLLGVVGVSLTVAALYSVGAYLGLRRYGMADTLTPVVVAWFMVFLTLAVLMYAALFVAVGAAAGDIKETQALLTPIMLLAALPMFMIGPVMQDPSGKVAVVGSFIPFSSPMIMMARVAVPPGIGWGQPLLAVLIVLTTSAACVWAAGRIFRVGLLMQGKGVKLSDLARWVING
jgi:ABC-type Na+ efflux pump permease subunit